MPQLTKKEKKKAERAEKLRKDLGKVRDQVKKDLSKAKPGSKEFCLALAVSLIDETYARVGNKNSEEENGHFGVTGWRKEHVSFSGGKAKIKYVGKSGVSHEKTVENKAAVKALKALYDSAEKKSDPLFRYEYNEEGARLNSSDVNSYLEPFGITAKDIRGFHANEEMRNKLKAIRKENGALPDDKKEREEALKKEFEEAVESVAKCLGHEPATLRNQYLVHNFEKTFLEGGSPMDKFSRIERIKNAVLWRTAGVTHFKTPDFPGTLDVSSLASVHRALTFGGTQHFTVELNLQKRFILVNLNFDYTGTEESLALLFKQTAWGEPWKIWQMAGKWNASFKFGR